ncbi:hypothetical protein BpHYR1_009935 [Brachionus plicatilis]|uniref:Uncharacterized protein n=1 Tax=Brachionus plicatilis TaxID=10195 RepID=A0A3M7RTG9_BRAPC|nr:hypothetical protein BpHYR1_009935 [Brachionus plicatilis]
MFLNQKHYSAQLNLELRPLNYLNILNVIFNCIFFVNYNNRSTNCIQICKVFLVRSSINFVWSYNFNIAGIFWQNDLYVGILDQLVIKNNQKNLNVLISGIHQHYSSRKIFLISPENLNYTIISTKSLWYRGCISYYNLQNIPDLDFFLGLINISDKY